MNQLTARSIRDKLTNLDTYNLAMTHKQKGGVQGGEYYLTELQVDLESLLEGFERVAEFATLLPTSTRLATRVRFQTNRNWVLGAMTEAYLLC